MTSMTLKWLLFLAVLASSANARADCVETSEATAQSTCVVYTLNGVRGVWFRLDVADEVRRIRLEVPELRLQVTRLTGIDEVQTARVEMYREAATERREALTLAEAQIDAGLRREHALREEVTAWYRAPALWFAIGVVVTAGSGVALALAVDR